jgi:hypothetical protein
MLNKVPFFEKNLKRIYTTIASLTNHHLFQVDIAFLARVRYGVQGWNRSAELGRSPCVGALPHTPSVLHCSSNRYILLSNNYYI